MKLDIFVNINYMRLFVEVAIFENQVNAGELLVNAV